LGIVAASTDASFVVAGLATLCNALLLTLACPVRAFDAAVMSTSTAAPALHLSIVDEDSISAGLRIGAATCAGGMRWRAADADGANECATVVLFSS
jgi:hypothetical protein